MDPGKTNKQTNKRIIMMDPGKTNKQTKGRLRVSYMCFVEERRVILFSNTCSSMLDTVCMPTHLWSWLTNPPCTTTSLALCVHTDRQCQSKVCI